MRFCGINGHTTFSIWSVFLLLCIILLVDADIITPQSYVNNTRIHSLPDKLNISDICPGIEYLYNQTNITVLRDNVSEMCEKENKQDFTTHQGVMYAVCDSSIYCCLHIVAPEGMHLRAYVRRLSYWCESIPWRMQLYGGDHDRFYKFTNVSCSDYSADERYFNSGTNRMYFSYKNIPPFEIKIEVIDSLGFIVEYESAMSGHVLLPDLEYFTGRRFTLSVELKIPPKSVIMVSFLSKDNKNVCIDMIFNETETGHRRNELMCGVLKSPPTIFRTSCLEFLLIITKADISFYDIDQHIFFTFHDESRQPPQLSKGVFNCCVDYYDSFQRHLDCNLKTECEDGQDESQHCPFSNAGCQGLVASHNKCFQTVKLYGDITQQIATRECLKMGGRLVSLKTRQEQEDFLQMLKIRYYLSGIIGNISGWESGPVMYSKLRKWSDNTVIYNMNHFVSVHTYRPVRDQLVMGMRDTKIFYRQAELMELSLVVCETKPQSENVIPAQAVQFSESQSPPLSIFGPTRQMLFGCPDLHTTHTFLACDSGSTCVQMISSQHCVILNIHDNTKSNTLPTPRNSPVYTIALFKCEDDFNIVPFTLVCDFRQNCPDNSDESFCLYPSCDGFLCSNEQCVWHSQRCNGHADCLDNSDEVNCTEQSFDHREADRRERVFVNLDGTGYFIQQVMKVHEPCPETHYWCQTDILYCLPTYTRCNGYSDCTYGDDEQDCEMLTCPGFYQCRASRVCVHKDHLCDGWGQCPQRDDEWFCDMTCPEYCICQGNSVICLQPSSVDLFPQLRYLDATGSGMTLADVSTNTYLVHLSLSRCSLVDITTVNLPNLQLIDLTNNRLRNVNMDVFSQLPNLRVLIMAKNPLILLTSKPLIVHYALEKLDVSGTEMETFVSEPVMCFPELQCLNLSLSNIKSIGSAGFKLMPRLTVLDMRENPLSQFQFNLLLGFDHLKTVLSSVFKVCCVNSFSKRSSKITCFAPESMFYSCTKLLPTDLYRFLFWLTSTCSVLGNLASFVAIITDKKLFEGNATKFLINIKVCNMCMGIHITVGTIINEIHSGNYVSHEKTWTGSVTCKMAAFLSLASSEVSVMVLCLVTLDHVITLCVPAIRWRLSQSSTVVACVVTWCLGVLLSAVPFLSRLSHWGLDDQSGLCRLALFDCYNCHQKFRWFTVTVICNFIFCLLVVIPGQIVIYRRTSPFQVLVDPSLRPMYFSVHLSANDAVTCSACWLSFGLIRLLAVCGMVLPDKIHVSLVVFMLPLSSALSPLLHLWTVVAQRRQHAQEEKVLRLLKSRLTLTANATK